MRFTARLGRRQSQVMGVSGDGKTWSHGSHILARGTTVLVWAAVLAGPAGLVLALTSAGSAPETETVSANEIDTAISTRSAVGEFAERIVVTWLTATRDDPRGIEQIFGDTNRSLPTDPVRIDRSAVSEIQSAGGGVWSVIVAVDLVQSGGPATDRDPSTNAEDNDREPGGNSASRTRYFQVPVRVDRSGALAAQALPAAVPAPTSAEPQRLAYRHKINTSSFMIN